MSTGNKTRCSWVAQLGNDLCIPYHDIEWGVPLHDDRKLFEAVILDGFQAGLSWTLMLKKRDNFRLAFDDFDAEKIATYNEAKVAELLEDSGIIRNKLKIRAAITNAQAFLKLQESFGSFDQYIWQFVDHKPIINKWHTVDQLPTRSEDSDAMSKDMKKHGFKFVGTTICYAFMQAVGLINDHEVGCYRYQEIIDNYES